MSEIKHDATPEALSGLNPSSRVRILCADDQPEIRASISKCLLRAGYQVTSVADGEQAWQALQSAPYDLFITDQQMPRLSGAELILRMRLTGMAMPVVVASSDLEFFTASHCQWLRIAAVLPKPFGAGELVRTVKQAMNIGSSICSGFPPVFPDQMPTASGTTLFVTAKTEKQRQHETNR